MKVERKKYLKIEEKRRYKFSRNFFGSIKMKLNEINRMFIPINSLIIFWKVLVL